MSLLNDKTLASYDKKNNGAKYSSVGKILRLLKSHLEIEPKVPSDEN